MSVLNIIRYSAKGVLIKSLKAQQPILRNECWSSVLLNQSSKPVQISASSFSTSLILNHSPPSKRQSLLSNSQSIQTPFRCMSADHSHSKLWTVERFLSAGLLGLLPLGLAYPSPAIDYALALALVVHVHWGVEAIAVDYLRASVVGAAISKASVVGVYALTILTLGGLFYFNYTDVGLCHAIRMLWKL